MTLLKKAVRSIWDSRRAYISCTLLIAIGIMTYTSFNAVFVDLATSQTRYYADKRFADVFADVRAMPRDKTTLFDTIPGISGYTARLSEELRVIEADSTAAIRIVVNTYDPEESEPVNDFNLLKGERSRGGIILGEDFAAANGLDIGDSIALNIAGRTVDLPVTGIAGSPEYIYHIRSIYEMLPDPGGYGFAYMDYRDLAPLLGKSGRVNDIGFTLEEGVGYEDVRYLLEDALTPYGLTALTQRKDQLSHSMLDQELNSIGSMASALPLVFIGMSVTMLYIMLRRIIGQERTQIGILKAYGHSNGQVIGHYLCYGAVVGLTGGLLGDILGYGLAVALNMIYSGYFKLPRLDTGINPFYMIMGVTIATLSGMTGAFFGAAGVLRLSPSEAMRPAAPPPVRFDLLSRLRVIQALLATSGRIALRSIDRGRFRSAFVALGVCFSFSIMAFMASYSDMFEALLFDQFTKVEIYDMKIGLESPVDYREGIESAWGLPGVSAAEGILEIPAELFVDHRNTSALLIAIEPDAALYRLFDSGSRTFKNLPTGGVVLSNVFADELEAAVGDLVRIKSPYLPREVSLPVMGLVKQDMGSGCYLQMHTLWDMMESGPVVSGLLVNTGAPDDLKAALEAAKNVAAVTHQNETMVRYRDFIEGYIPLINGMQVIGIVIAFAIINTTSSISLSERRREYATLRVLGMQPTEVSRIMTFEYGLLTAAGMLFGIPLTYWLKVVVSGMMDTEMFSIPLTTPPAAFVSAAIGCVIAVLLVGYSMRKQVAGFDLIDVLKERK